MPVLYLGRYIDNLSRSHLNCFLAPFLIIASSANADKHLTAAAFSVVDMPVVAAGRLKGNIENRYLLG